MCVEDNDLVADAIERKLQGLAGFEWIGRARTLDETMALAAERQPHVVCMDLDIPGQDTFAMIRGLAEKHPEVRVLMLTGHVQAELIGRAVSAGVWGYVSKAEESRVIVDAIRRVAAGEFVLVGIARSECGTNPPARPAPPEPGAPLEVQTRSWNPLRGILHRGGRK